MRDFELETFLEPLNKYRERVVKANTYRGRVTYAGWDRLTVIDECIRLVKLSWEDKTTPSITTLLGMNSDD